MARFKRGTTYFLATLLVGLISGCGQEVVDVPAVTSTTPAQGATDVAVDTAISATFSMAMNPATITAATFTVSGPDGAAVAGVVTYSTSIATFTPTAPLAYGTLYTATITIGAKNLGGTPLLADYVWAFTTMAPVPVPPMITATVPLNGATGVSVDQALSATFSETMNPATISGSTFTLTGPGSTPVAGVVTYSGSVAVFTPAASLASGTLYTATITTGATNAGGVPLGSNYVWTFTTIAAPPAVIATVPLNAATGVPLAQVVTATFNEAMNCATLSSPATTFTLAGPGAVPIAGTVTCAGTVASFTPASNLAVNTVYTATITTGAQGLAGTALAGNYVWAFRTLPAPTPPTVISTVPLNLAMDVPINQALSATFSVAMNPATLDAATFTLVGPGANAVSGVVTYVPAGSVATFAPSANLTPNTLYTATITIGATDLEGTPLAQNFVWTFTTAATPIITPPTVISTIPANTAVDVPLNQAMGATFSEAMNPATIDSTTFSLT